MLITDKKFKDFIAQRMKHKELVRSSCAERQFAFLHAETGGYLAAYREIMAFIDGVQKDAE